VLLSSQFGNEFPDAGVRLLDQEAIVPTGFRKRLRRLLAFGFAVMKHGIALLVTFIGSVILSIPSWIEPLLSPIHSRQVSESLTVSPHTYRYLAMAFLV
jgi:hypothetical protein